MVCFLTPREVKFLCESVSYIRGRSQSLFFVLPFLGNRPARSPPVAVLPLFLPTVLGLRSLLALTSPRLFLPPNPSRRAVSSYVEPGCIALTPFSRSGESCFLWPFPVLCVLPLRFWVFGVAGNVLLCSDGHPSFLSVFRCARSVQLCRSPVVVPAFVDRFLGDRPFFA